MSNLEFGWIKLHRKIIKHWIWDEGTPFDDFHAWIDLILNANYESGKVKIGSDVLTINPGQMQTSVQHLAARWHWSRSKVFRFLKMLETERMIYTKRNKNGTTLTIAKYGFYQDSRNTERNTNDTDGDTDDDTSFETMAIPNVRSKESYYVAKKLRSKDNSGQAAGDFSGGKKQKKEPPPPLKIGDVVFDTMVMGVKRYKICRDIWDDGYINWEEKYIGQLSQWEMERIRDDISPSG